MFIFKLRVGLMYLQNIKSYLHDLDFYTGIHFYKRFLMIGEGVQHIHHAKYWRTFYNFHILFKSGYNYHDFEILNPSCLRTLFEMFFCILSFLFSHSISTRIIKYLCWLQINRLISVLSLQFSKSNTWYYFFQNMVSKYTLYILIYMPFNLIYVYQVFL